MAYIPATNDGKGKQTYLQRPRFLALSEFGPNSLVYHEGRAYRVVRAMLSLNHEGAAPADRKLPVRPVRICRRCGAAHWNDDISICHACGDDLGDAEIVNHTYRIENVSTRPAERITANDEERRRQGFEIRTTFEWATREKVLDLRHAVASDAEGDVAHLSYGAGATITRLNKGLRRRKNRNVFGFMIDPVSGYWEKSEEEPEPNGGDPTALPRQRIVPTVEDRKNALLFRPLAEEVGQTTVATIQHALLRGLETVFQLEEGEILAEPMPVPDARTSFLLYEATEGGAGVLTRLVSDPDRLAQVAREALRILHFTIDNSMPDDRSELTDAEGTVCVAACYRCVMSYYNQTDHELLDRRDADARSILLRLARAWVTTPLTSDPESDVRTVPASDERTAAWAEFARTRDLMPDSQAMEIDAQRVPLVWRDHYVAALFDEDEALARKLESKGFEVIVLGKDEVAWSERSAQLSKLLGKSE
jgi:hypothetical protein